MKGMVPATFLHLADVQVFACITHRPSPTIADGGPPETDHFNRLPCGCPLDSGCTGWHQNS